MQWSNDPALARGLEALITYLVLLLLGVLVILIFYLLGRVVAWILWRVTLQRARIQKQPLSERRSNTVHSLARSVMDGVSVVLAVVFMLSLFVEPGVLVASLGLFSAGLGFAAKNYISDVFQGIQPPAQRSHRTRRQSGDRRTPDAGLRGADYAHGDLPARRAWRAVGSAQRRDPHHPQPLPRHLFARQHPPHASRRRCLARASRRWRQPLPTRCPVSWAPRKSSAKTASLARRRCSSSVCRRADGEGRGSGGSC